MTGVSGSVANVTATVVTAGAGTGTAALILGSCFRLLSSSSSGSSSCRARH